jgi:hypothetical protein
LQLAQLKLRLPQIHPFGDIHHLLGRIIPPGPPILAD